MGGASEDHGAHADDQFLCHSAVEYHQALLDNKPSVLELIEKFISSEEINFVHIALWIISQFSSVAGEGLSECLSMLSFPAWG